ncbi:ABC transporter ATP-binding protein [Marinobacterium rhizophilum]|uniref:ABC transporter ATP-binding protein n=1 Tax=Marinobacterium rhizophilum TaxID=420402 RepID=UPI00039D3EE4|nr:sn-glycerol-3-phosphate ABC transporter ATP-binding protein UgpC [Marinobacterium rhizophilum]
MASVTLKKINKVFGHTHILHDIDLSIHDGEFVVFVGPSGCGKSTLLRLIAGLEEISSGDLDIGGQLVNELTPKERGVGMVFQSYALYPHLSVYDNIAFGLKLAKESGETVTARVENTARILHLEPLLHRKPKELSGGQRQRVAIGRAMAREPRILLFDEPLSNLDASLRVKMRTEIAKLHQRVKSTMVYVTHDQVEAMTLADKIVVLNAGRIEQVGSPFELYESPASLFVASFIGSPKMNLLPASLAAPDPYTSQVAVPGVGQVDVAVDSQHLDAGCTLTLGIRPEHLELEPASGGENCLEVVNVEYLGNESYVYIQHPDEDELLVARVPVPVRVRPGQLVRLLIKPELAYVFDADGRAVKRTVPAPEVSTVSHA